MYYLNGPYQIFKIILKDIEDASKKQHKYKMKANLPERKQRVICGVLRPQTLTEFKIMFAF